MTLTCVSAGAKFSEYEKSLYDAGEYLEYNYVHGLSVEPCRGSSRDDT